MTEVFFVSSNGSDDLGEGTSEKPFLSINQVMSVCGPDALIHVVEGAVFYRILDKKEMPLSETETVTLKSGTMVVENYKLITHLPVQ